MKNVWVNFLLLINSNTVADKVTLQYLQSNILNSYTALQISERFQKLKQSTGAFIIPAL